MTSIDNWLARYEQVQENIRLPVVYWVAILMIVVAATSALWSFPVPVEFEEISPLLNWGSAFLMVAAVYYFIISLSLAIGLLPFLLALAALQIWFESIELPTLALSTALFAMGTVGLGVARGGSSRALVEDVQLAMIGPVWLLSLLYRRFGIPV